MRMSIRLCECEGAGEPSCLGSSSAAPSPSLPSLPSPRDGLRRDCIGDVGAEEVKELLQEEEASEAEEEEEAPQAIEGAAGDAANGDGGGRLMPRPGRLPRRCFGRCCWVGRWVGVGGGCEGVWWMRGGGVVGGSE